MGSQNRGHKKSSREGNAFKNVGTLPHPEHAPTATIYDRWTVALKYSPFPIIAFCVVRLKRLNRGAQ